MQPVRPAIPVAREVVIQALLDVVRADRELEWYAPDNDSLVSDVEAVLDGLETDEMPVKDLAKIEWAWLAALEDRRRGPKALQQAIIDAPELFVDALKLAYRGEGEEPRELNKTEEAMARQRTVC